MTQNSSGRREGIIEVLDELIFHLNTTRSTFTFMIISSFILAPLALIIAAIFTFHPRFLFFLLDRVPQVGAILIVFVAITVVLASIWLAIGLKERRFFASWNRRYSKFMTLRGKIDRELGDDDKDQGSGLS